MHRLLNEFGWVMYYGTPDDCKTYAERNKITNYTIEQYELHRHQPMQPWH